MMMYQPIYRSDDLTIGKGNPVIVTGWTPTRRVRKHLAEQDYAAIGHLYSASRGINFLVRNLLFNTQVRDIIALNCTKHDKTSGSINALKRLFTHGVQKADDDVMWQIPGYESYIDGSIPEEAINNLRDNVNIHVIENISKLRDRVAICTDSEPWGEPEQYPEENIRYQQLPADLAGHHISADTIGEAWIELLQRVWNTGETRDDTRELLNTLVTIKNEPGCLDVQDWLPIDRETILEYFPQVYTQTEDRNAADMAYTYGDRIHEQLKTVINQINYRPNARRFTINLWKNKDTTHPQPPCLTNLWFRVIKGQLHMTLVFRSHDIWGAWLSNAFAFRLLQRLVADETGHNLGSLNILSESAHVYEYDAILAESYIDSFYPLKNRKYDDPIGNFEVVTNKDGYLQVNHFHPTNDKLINYYVSDGNAQKLCYKVIDENPSIQPRHAAYLMSQLL